MSISPRTLRPSSNFTPRSISGLALWLDASESSALFQNSDGTVPATASSDPVGYWADKSGNGRHLTQAISGSRPSLLPTGISSKPCLNFDGTDDNIWRQPGLTSDDLSILVVHQSNALGGGITYEFTHQGDTTNAQAVNATGFVNVAGLQVAASGSPTYMSDVQRSFTNVDIQGRSGTAGDLTVNVPVLSTQCVSYSATASAIRKQAWTSGKGMLNSVRFNCGGWSAVTLGARRNNLAAGGINSPSVFLSGRIAEVIAYSRYISDADRRRLELYLARKWSVTLTGAPIVSNAEAQDWIDRVYGNGGSVSTATAQAVNQFCLDIENAPGGSIRDKFFRVNLFAGSNLNAALTPLYLGPTPLGIRYGNTTDSNVGSLFVSANYGETTGLTAPLSSTNYLDTGFTTAGLPASVYESMHMSGWHGPIGPYVTDPFLLGVFSTERHGLQTSIRTAAPAFETGRMGKSITVLATNGVQGARPSTFLLTQRTSATSLQLYRNGVLENTTTTSVTGIGTLAFPVFVFRYNNAGTVAGDQPGMPLRHYSIGDDMTEPQVLAFYNALAAFNTAMGRTA